MEDMTAVPSVPEVMTKKRGISGSTLKLIAIFVMLIDHIAATILEQTLLSRGFFNYNTVASIDAANIQLYTIYRFMRGIGRLGFPLFCFLLVEGFVHTRNKGKYALRLGIFALISEIPFDLAFHGNAFYFEYQNVFFTLLIGFLVMWGFQVIRDKLKDKKWLPVLSVVGAAGAGYIVFVTVRSLIYTVTGFYESTTGRSLTATVFYLEKKIIIGAAVVTVIGLLAVFLTAKKKEGIGVFLAACTVLVAGMLLADFMITDYSGFGVLTIAVMYALRKEPAVSAMGGYFVLNIMSLSELAAIFALIPIGLYNGERGLRLKYVFYAFYPVHLFILYLICKAMNIM